VRQADVRARRIGGGEPVVTATASDGTFTLELPPGTYGVRVTAWTPRWYGLGPTVEVKAGERVSADVDLTLGPSISGQLVDEKGGPVPGAASACFVAAGEEECGGADEQGFFAVYGLAGGKDYVPDVRVNFFEFLAPANASAFPLVHVPDAGIEVKGVTLVVKRGR
jgi:hypothetical protein